MKQKPAFPPKDTIETLLQIFAAGNSGVTVHPIAGDFYNAAHIVEAHFPSGASNRFVVKQYAECGNDLSKKARTEFKALTWLQARGVPAPRPVYLDETGEVFGGPGIVTSHVAGKQRFSCEDYPNLAQTVARTLAQIHSTPCDDDARDFLLDANSEVLWFLRGGVMPDYMRAHPDGLFVWETIHSLLPNIERVSPVLVHTDYWLGNVLWNGEQITAVLDWEEAAYGDAGVDVAYCRMDLFLNGMGREKANEFLNAYETAAGQPVANLALWELAAAVRPMHDPAWEVSVRQQLREFIADIRARVSFHHESHE